MGRATGKCAECGEERDIIGGQREGSPRCSTCFQRHARREENPWRHGDVYSETVLASVVRSRMIFPRTFLMELSSK